MTLLRVESLNVSFKSFDGNAIPAVQDVSFSLEAGESLAIVGESGSGKSVAMRAVMGLLDPRAVHSISGMAYYGEKDPAQSLLDNPSVQGQLRGCEIAMIFQEPMTALNPVMRCGKQIVEVIRRHLELNKEEEQQRLVALLEEVQLPDIQRMIRSYPHELSGGQRQRIMIAMALAANPRLLIADEPTTALDVAVQAKVLELLKKIQKERNMALIFISHDLGVVKRVTDRVMVMFRGKKLEEGPTEKVLSQPQHIYTKALIQCRPSAHKKGERLPVMKDIFELDEQGNFLEKSGYA
ncbi:MAG: ABC transporter ATP-binding protein, partial [Bacteroidota bacterium]|nr:ABC transporter ATP-binding protein [Bacteroidota bacterium]MDX5429495.1 ABC transporter ATP-binding protein [Bacteroidota bacterium]MDX5468280.1 ABC transporter ATP-binding protein [Bacteroidota bacterium]